MQLYETNAYTFDAPGFEKWLKKKGDFSERSIKSYLDTLKVFFSRVDGLTPESYQEYIEGMVEDEYSLNRVNLSIVTINKYLKYLVSTGHKECAEWAQKSKKILKQQYLDDILSMADYEYFLKKAEAEKKWAVYLYARIAGTTGMRLCEMLQIKREHIEHGCVDIYGKGRKQRRIYFPATMKEKVLEILDEVGLKSGYIFSPRFSGEKKGIESTIQHGLKTFSENVCGFPRGLVHSHGFRHFFAKEFVRKYQNIALLADLLGHSNIETTRIYLKYTSREQAEIVDEVVTW